MLGGCGRCSHEQKSEVMSLPDRNANPAIPLTALGQPLVTGTWALRFKVLGLRVTRAHGSGFRGSGNAQTLRGVPIPGSGVLVC